MITRTGLGVYLVDDWPGEILEETEETHETHETENSCWFFCPMCMKEFRLETEPGDHHEVFCETCGNLVLFGRTRDMSGLVMFLLF